MAHTSSKLEHYLIIEGPILFLGGTFQGTRCASQNGACAIYWALLNLDDLVCVWGWFHHTYGPPQPTFHEQPWFQKSVPVEIGHTTLRRHYWTRRRKGKHTRGCVQPVDHTTTTRRTTVLYVTTNLNTTFPYIPPCTLGGGKIDCTNDATCTTRN